MSAPSKSWVFTLNNPSAADLEWVQALEVARIVCGREGADSTPHLQGFVVFTRAYRLAQLKKLQPRAHWEVARCKDAGNYCLKEGDIIRREDNTKQGSRTDLKKTHACARAGITMREFMAEEPSYQMIKVFELARGVLQKPRDFKPEVRWLYGPTGAGKTRTVVSAEPDLWISSRNLKWWQGYENQDAVLFDDFRGDFCTFHELLRILDRYAFEVEVKGGSRTFNSRRIWITSCHHPKDAYRGRTDEDVAQLLRRIDEIRELRTVAVTETVTEVGEGNTDFPNASDEIVVVGRV